VVLRVRVRVWVQSRNLVRKPLLLILAAPLLLAYTRNHADIFLDILAKLRLGARKDVTVSISEHVRAPLRLRLPLYTVELASR
jgi:hypothetical protein